MLPMICSIEMARHNAITRPDFCLSWLNYCFFCNGTCWGHTQNPTRSINKKLFHAVASTPAHNDGIKEGSTISDPSPLLLHPKHSLSSLRLRTLPWVYRHQVLIHSMCCRPERGFKHTLSCKRVVSRWCPRSAVVLEDPNVVTCPFAAQPCHRRTILQIWWRTVWRLGMVDTGPSDSSCDPQRAPASTDMGEGLSRGV